MNLVSVTLLILNILLFWRSGVKNLGRLTAELSGGRQALQHDQDPLSIRSNAVFDCALTLY